MSDSQKCSGIILGSLLSVDQGTICSAGCQKYVGSLQGNYLASDAITPPPLFIYFRYGATTSNVQELHLYLHSRIIYGGAQKGFGMILMEPNRPYAGNSPTICIALAPLASIYVPGSFLIN